MAYEISRSAMGSVTDAELVFGTVRMLPPEEAIPAEFKEGNLYTKVASALFYGDKLPDCEMVFLSGFEDESAPADLSRCVRAHLASRSPRHDHKIAGVGLMIAGVCRLRDPESSPT